MLSDVFRWLTRDFCTMSKPFVTFVHVRSNIWCIVRFGAVERVMILRLAALKRCLQTCCIALARSVCAFPQRPSTERHDKPRSRPYNAQTSLRQPTSAVLDCLVVAWCSNLSRVVAASEL
jgi:hypothetical protein